MSGQTTLTKVKGIAVRVFLPGDDPIACFNKAMAFMSPVVASHTRTQGNASSSGANNAAGQGRVIKCYNCQGERHMARQCTKPKRPRNSAWFKEKMLLVQAQEEGQTDDLDACDFDCDDISSAKAILMANLSSYDLDILFEVVQIVLWYLDSGCSKHMTGNRSQLINFVHKFLGTIRFGNDQIAKIMGYGDYQMGKVTISRVYYVEGLGHNLFFVGQ
ncbi:retrovirus-related pol polyprotein from transposon TNT 1-94 [Tanacetum coccineum]